MNVLTAGILIPLIGSLLLPFLGRVSAKLRNAAALGLVAAAFICAIAALPAALRGAPISARFELPLGLSFGVLGDPLAVFVAMAAALVSLVIILYSYGYIKHYPNQNEYYMMVSLFIGAMMGLVYSTNLIALYTFWELSTLCCWRLIGFYREEITITKANKTFIVTVLGALFMLVGFIGIYGQTGTFELSAMKGAAIPSWTVACVLCGILSKSATFPLHSWLPDAGVAPSPVTSLLHAAVLVKIGVYAYARLFVLTFTIDGIFTTVVPIIAVISAIITAGVAFRENDLKRVLAYSTISQLAFIIAGLSCGAKTGIIGGVLYIAAHAIAKGGLFLCAGIVEHSTHTKDLRKMGGLAKTMPLTAVSFILCAFSIMGIPPFFGFFTKFLVIDGVVQSGQLLLAILFILCAVLTVMYLMRLFVKVFLGEQTFREVKEGSKIMLASVVALAAFSLLFGFISFLPSRLSEMMWG